MQTSSELPIGQLIRAARQQLQMSQYDLADKLAAVSGNATMGRDRVARWERGRQIPRNEWRQWLSIVLCVPKATLDTSAAAARRRSQLGNAAVTANPPVNPNTARRNQGTPALLPVFRSRVQAGILAATLLNPNRSFSLTELADHAGGSLASVSKESELLEASGILSRRSEGTVRLVQAVTDRPMIGPLTDLIRITYGVPQIIGEELGRVAGITRITAIGTWAARFAGLSGPEPDTIQLRLTADLEALDEDELEASARRAEKRINRGIRYSIVAPGADGSPIVPQQRDRRPIVDVAVIPPRAGQPTIVDPWENGNYVVRQLLADRQLELISGVDTSSAPFLELAAAHLDAAKSLAGSFAAPAFLLICQAAQLIGAGLLARQGLRAAGGAAANAMSHAVVAQFGPEFTHVELLRQRAMGLSSPISRDNRASAADVADYLPTVHGLLVRAHEIVPGLSLFA